MTAMIRNALVLGSLLVASALFGVDRSALAEEAPTLYTRLGQWDGIQQIVRDTIANHRKNPAIAHFFDGVDDDRLAAHVTAFFAAGTGGPNQYEGRDMTSTHATMGLSNEDFDKAVADVLLALDMNDIGDAEKSEVATILESLRPAVMGTGS